MLALNMSAAVHRQKDQRVSLARRRKQVLLGVMSLPAAVVVSPAVSASCALCVFQIKHAAELSHG